MTTDRHSNDWKIKVEGEKKLASDETK